jgi:hypothetical protein
MRAALLAPYVSCHPSHPSLRSKNENAIVDLLLATAQSQHQVQSAFLLDVVVRQCATVLELLAREDQSLLVRGDAFLVLNLRLDVVDGVARFDFQCDRLAGQSLNEDLHATSQSQDEMQCGFLLDVIVRQCATVLELLAREDQSLLVRGDALLVLDLGLDVVDGVARFDFQCDRLARQSLNEDLHATSQSQDEMQCGFLLDVVVAQGTSILELLAREDEALLVRGDALLVLDLGLDIVDGVARFDFQCDRLAGQSLDEDLHATTETKDQVKGGLLLNVVVAQGTSILELLTREDEALLVRGDALLVLDLALDIVNGI